MARAQALTKSEMQGQGRREREGVVLVEVVAEVVVEGVVEGSC